MYYLCLLLITSYEGEFLSCYCDNGWLGYCLV